MRLSRLMYVYYFFFNDTATTEIYTLSLHDALPISIADNEQDDRNHMPFDLKALQDMAKLYPGKTVIKDHEDRKSTRLNSSHANISYAVFCLKKKKKYHNKCHHLLYNISLCILDYDF